MKTKILCLFAALSVFSAAATAEAVSPADYADRFKVDMNEQIPPIEELRKMFAPKPVYDRKFDYFWNIGTVFDKGFAKTIRQYGTRQTRLKWPGEDIMLEQLKNTPKEYYQYIGPYLHTIPGISEKILNYPGIKETKNQFPKRIAPQLADIENLEFMSPALYFALNPDLWEESNLSREQVKFRTLPQVNRYDTSFIDKVMETVPPEVSAEATGSVLSFLLHPTVESANAAISAMHRRMDSSFFMLNLFITILLSCYSFPACLETAA